MLTFRPFNLEADATEIARLYGTVNPEPVTVEDIRNWWAVHKDEIRTTMLALDNDTVVGYWDVDREPWMRPGYFFIKVIIAPEVRKKGIGAQLYTDALATARGFGAQWLQGSVRDNDPLSLRFAERRGFRIEHHAFESTLDLEAFDESQFADITCRALEQGFRFFSLAEAGQTEENRHRLYEVNRATALDNPGNDGTFPDYESFCVDVYNAHWFRADTQILAAEGERWVGLSAIGIYPTDNHAYNAFTGILKEYRGRGLAQALKLHTILLAKKEGARYVRTHNDSQNAPMLAINRKLGYKPEPGIYRLLCALE
jgi:GNAT superfamily N-acetyltransferase